MSNIFSKKDQYIDRVNRSTFDLSFVNNFTTNFGVITPVCLLPVGFGDSVQINAKFNLQLMPTVFPIQTQMYARLHFVYVRTRTIWEDWQAFFGGDESVTPPWMDPTKFSNSNIFSVADDLQTSTLADYLGVPTVITGKYGAVEKVPTNLVEISKNGTSVGMTDYKFLPYFASDLLNVSAFTSYIESSGVFEGKFTSTTLPGVGWSAFVVNFTDLNFGTVGRRTVFLDLSKFTDNSSNLLRYMYFGEYSSLSEAIKVGHHGYSIYYPSIPGDVKLNGSVAEIPLSSSFTNTWKLVIFIPSSTLYNELEQISFYYRPDGYGDYNLPISSLADSLVSAFSFTSVDVEWSKPEADNCPFWANEGMPAIPLSALPFRVYEAYYNAFGRDVRNNPFMIDGKPEYNRYVPSLAGGVDRYKYQLHYANWEPDAYTTALQSPQAGVAPLVGITSLGEAQFRDANGTTYTAQLETADDGDTVTGFQMQSSDAPADVVRNLIGMATSGISISDFRNVNSLQRFLEIRIRQSPRYLNLVKGLFNVNLDYDELMMPEFLGGISDNVPVYKVTQTTPTDGSPLGSFAGQGFIQSGMKHVIRKYCPEEGYILGVLSVVPVANYTQLLAPHWTRMSLLDWHFPQFNNVSFQPMTYKNLCPYQAYAVNPSNVNSVFGYQRAWWDLISSFDEVHGQFRSSLRNFVINRVFDSAPELSQDFLLVNPDHVNDVFATTAENGDKILGSIAFDITKKTTIPRNSIPHIE
uniref:Major capsid protein n=1 Tax=Dulem virus 258 TaxID=3145735 RepID=A0AAU8B5X3_9VIRU